jgi:hypothetical protein
MQTTGSQWKRPVIDDDRYGQDGNEYLIRASRCIRHGSRTGRTRTTRIIRLGGSGTNQIISQESSSSKKSSVGRLLLRTNYHAHSVRAGAGGTWGLWWDLGVLKVGLGGTCVLKGGTWCLKCGTWWDLGTLVGLGDFGGTWWDFVSKMWDLVT